jgi:aspartyl-tRNA(Asn)/glutamyl-tRNA(Gln) amidotransferase subunit C
MVEQLQEVNTDQVPQMKSVSTDPLPRRRDEIKDGNIAEDIVRNAPLSEYNCFVVPKVVE